MKVFSVYPLNQPYMHSANSRRSNASCLSWPAQTTFGSFSRGSGLSSGLSMTGVCYTKSDRPSSPTAAGSQTCRGSVNQGNACLGRSVAAACHAPQRSGAEDIRQLRRKLRHNEAAQEAVVTVVEEEDEGKRRNKGTAGTSDSSGEESGQKIRRIVNTSALAVMSGGREGGFMDLTDVQDDEEEDLLAKKFQYNSQEISAQIQRAKTSNGAGQAAIKATRKVMELKNKLAAGGDDIEEIRLALTHAKQIERVAKKKKRHLEVEEMIVSTQKQDERLEKEQEARTAVLPWDTRDLSEEEITERLSEMDRRQSERFAALAEAWRNNGDNTGSRQLESLVTLAGIAGAWGNEAPESDVQNGGSLVAFAGAWFNRGSEGAGSTEEMVASLDALLEKLGGKEQQVLEEVLENMELTEVTNPHMSREDLKMLRIKHRNAERKDIVKADTDYLKGVFEHLQKKGVSMPSFAGADRTLIAAYTPFIPAQGADGGKSVQGAPAINVQV